MENALEVLIIILSATLTIFLLLGIVLLVICIRITKSIKHVTEKAEHISDKAENITEFLSKSAMPLAAGKFIAVITEIFRGNKSKSKRRK